MMEPHVPVQQPHIPTQQPQAPVQRPYVPVQQPQAPVQQPQIPAQQPFAPVQPTWYPASPPKPKREYRKADGLYAMACLLLGYMGVRWLFFGGYGYGTTGLFVLFALSSMLYLKHTGAPLTPSFYGWMALLLVFGASFSLYGQTAVSALCGLFLLLFGTLWVSQGGQGMSLLRPCLPVDQSRALFIHPFSSYGGGGGAFFSLFRKSSGRRLRGVLLGLLLAVPMTLLTGSLLLRADAAFSGFLQSLLPQRLDVFLRQGLLNLFYLGLGIPAALAVFSLAFSARRRQQAGKGDEANWANIRRQVRVFSPSILYAAMTPVCVLYVLFFLSQSAYFFSAFANYLPEGFSYADYARQGFFELCGVALINFALVLVLQIFCKPREGTDRVPLGARLYTAVLGGFTLLLIATALRKMLLYIDGYGLTPLRVYTSWFMILLAGIFLLLLIGQAAVRFPLMKGMAAWGVVLLGILCFSNVNGWIAKYNVEHYLSGDLTQMDVRLLEDLGPEAVPYAAALLEDKDEGVARQARIYLICAEAELENRPAAQGNLTALRARRVLQDEQVQKILRNYPQEEQGEPDGEFSW